MIFHLCINLNSKQLQCALGALQPLPGATSCRQLLTCLATTPASKFSAFSGNIGKSLEVLGLNSSTSQNLSKLVSISLKFRIFISTKVQHPARRENAKGRLRHRMYCAQPEWCLRKRIRGKLYNDCMPWAILTKSLLPLTPLYELVLMETIPQTCRISFEKAACSCRRINLLDTIT